MNKQQKSVVIAGAAIASIAILFPPYDLPGDIVPDIQYGPLWHRPVSDLEDYVGTKGRPDTWLLAVELTPIVLVTGVLVLAFRRKAVVSGQQAPGGSDAQPPQPGPS